MKGVVAGLAVALILVSSFGVFEYSQNQSQSSTIDQKNALLAQLESKLGSDNALIASLNSTISAKDSAIQTGGSTIAALKANITALDARIATLDTEIQSLEATQTAAGGQITSLESQVSSLRNQTGLLQLELDVMGWTRGYFITTYFVNMIWTVGPNSTQKMIADANGHNGTLAVLGSGGPSCSNLGTGGLVQGQGFTVLLGDNGFGGTWGVWQTEGPAQFQVFIQNTGTTTQSCVLSAFYVYYSTPSIKLP